jgi:hypothetical protein
MDARVFFLSKSTANILSVRDSAPFWGEKRDFHFKFKDRLHLSD